MTFLWSVPMRFWTFIINSDLYNCESSKIIQKSALVVRPVFEWSGSHNIFVLDLEDIGCCNLACFIKIKPILTLGALKTAASRNWYRYTYVFTLSQKWIQNNLTFWRRYITLIIYTADEKLKTLLRFCGIFVVDKFLASPWQPFTVAASSCWSLRLQFTL